MALLDHQLLFKNAHMFQCPLFFIVFYSYHTGSLAFGSLILSLVQMIRVVLEYLDRKLKGDLCNFEKQSCWLYCVLMADVGDWLADSHNAGSRFLLCCLKCCFWCLEHFIRFINRNAYIMVSSMSNCFTEVSAVILLVCYQTSLLSSLTDSNIWKELLHLVQGCVLPLDEECYSVNHWLNLRNLLKNKKNLCANASRSCGFPASLL